MILTDRVDTIVIGGSAGGFSALKSIIPALPDELPAAIFVCLHQSNSFGGSRAADYFDSVASLPCRWAGEGVPITAGTVTFAAPDRHMMLGADHVHLKRGPHENNFRPAVDPLFRSAAVYRGPRAVGLILSGMLDDGAAGALALARTGGRILVQSPETADEPSMPMAALKAVPGAECIDLEDISARLIGLAGSPCGQGEPVPWQIGIELKISGLEGASMENEDRLGELSPYNCPHCNGVLWQIEDGPLVRYRCHTGHGYTQESLGAAQEAALDHGLFDSLRAHKGRAALIRDMADRMESGVAQAMMLSRAEKLEEDAAQLEEIIRNRGAVAAR